MQEWIIIVCKKVSSIKVFLTKIDKLEMASTKIIITSIQRTITSIMTITRYTTMMFTTWSQWYIYTI